MPTPRRAHPAHLALGALALCAHGCAKAAPAPPRDAAAARADAAAPADDAAAPDAEGEPAPAPDDAGAPADAGPSPRRITVTAGGDLLIHARVARAATEHRERGRLGWVLGWLQSLVTEREVAYADLETPLVARAARAPGDGSLTAAPPPFARDMARVGLDVVSVATNHAYDQTADGLDETLEALRAAGVGAVGAGRTDADAYAPWVAERDGVRVAFLGFTVRTDDGPGRNAHDIRVARVGDDPAQALEAIAAARGRADVVVVGVHWSRDFVRVPADGQRALARRMVDAGADLVLGAGPHVLQPVERVPSPRGEAVVAYSLGDLVSAYGTAYRPGRPAARGAALTPASDPAARDGALLRVTFELSSAGANASADAGAVEGDAGAAAGIAVTSLNAVALWTRTDGPDELRVVPMRAAEPEVRAERMPVITRALGAAVRVRP